MYAWFLMLWNWTALSFTYHNVHFYFFFPYFIVNLSIFSPYLRTCSTFYPSIYCYTCDCYTPQKSTYSSYLKTYLAINLILILILMLAVGQTVQQMDRYKGSKITKRSSVASKKCKKRQTDCKAKRKRYWLRGWWYFASRTNPSMHWSYQQVLSAKPDIFSLCATELHFCPQTIKNAWMSHTNTHWSTKYWLNRRWK